MTASSATSGCFVYMASRGIKVDTGNLLDDEGTEALKEDCVLNWGWCYF